MIRPGGIAPTLMTARVPSLSACFPVHDEEDNVVPMAESVLAMLPEVADAWELIIVDDGSRDATGPLADALARRHPGVHVVHHAENRGYGAAVRSALAAARSEYVFLTDGDRQFDPLQVRRLIPSLAQSDVVIGYRVRRADDFRRRVAGVVWTFVVRVVLGVRVRDVNCAFKLVRRAALAGVELESDGASISAELLAQLAARGQRVVELPVDHYPRLHGQASGNALHVVARAGPELWRVRRNVRALHRAR